MRYFSLETPVDFVYTMISSLYSITTDDLLSHFAAVANALNPGGLYFLDWYICFQWDEPSRDYYSWTIERGEVKIFVEYLREAVIDRVAQIGKYKCSMDVLDNGKKVRLESVEVSRVVFPQEFLLLLEKSGKFEFIGWWNHWNFDAPVEKAEHVSRPITVIRRLQ
ncbi:hypothetical protein FJZ31_42895 [Candidatus Poribacteria bacterium]|nr:hypothetical protein [Candidatus Poribacteria bacterium]